MEESREKESRRSVVFDSSAFISNALMFNASGSPFFGVLDGTTSAFSVPALMGEVRDSKSRERLRTIADVITFREPSVESINAVKRFAAKTGDLRSLSVVDIAVIALTYELEVAQNGLKNIKPEPMELEFTFPRRAPGVPINELQDDKQQEEGESKDDDDGWTTVKTRKKNRTDERRNPPRGKKNASKNSAQMQTDKHKESFPTNSVRETSAVCTEVLPKMSQRTLELIEEEVRVGTEVVEREGEDLSIDGVDKDGDELTEEQLQDLIDEFEAMNDAKDEEEDLRMAALVDERDKQPQAEVAEEEEEVMDDGVGWINPDNLEMELQKRKGMREAKQMIDIVGCVTTDYAMQNVILQMGLKLLSVDGSKVIKRVKRFILRCGACTELTRELDRLFCPRCGNNALIKLPFSINRQGVATVYFDPNRKQSLRGTKFPIPKPKGGRNCKDLILTEDQIEQRRRQLPRSGKKKKGDPFDPNTKYNAGEPELTNPQESEVKRGAEMAMRLFHLGCMDSSKDQREVAFE